MTADTASTGKIQPVPEVITDSGKVRKEKKTRIRTPKIPWKAAVMSACLPGLGQFYNGRWWKAPIIWGGLGTVGYFIYTNHTNYILYRDAYRVWYNTGIVPSPLESYQVNPTSLTYQRDFYQRTRDIFILVGTVVWLLNIVDASVDAHLSTFDVSDDLSLRISPGSFFTPVSNTPYLGVSFTFHLGKRGLPLNTRKF